VLDSADHSDFESTLNSPFVGVSCSYCCFWRINVLII